MHGKERSFKNKLESTLYTQLTVRETRSRDQQILRLSDFYIIYVVPQCQ